jgi:hypothetical protein
MPLQVVEARELTPDEIAAHRCSLYLFQTARLLFSDRFSASLS